MWYNLLAFYSGILSDILFLHSIWHLFWHPIWHPLWHLYWHFLWRNPADLSTEADSATLTPQGPSQRQCLAHATKMLEQYLNSKAPPLMLQCQHVVLWHEWRIQGLPGHLYQTSLRSCRAHLTVWTNAWFHPIFNNPGAHTHLNVSQATKLIEKTERLIFLKQLCQKRSTLEKAFWLSLLVARNSCIRYEM